MAFAFAIAALLFTAVVPMEGERSPFLALTGIILMLPSLVWLVAAWRGRPEAHAFVQALRAGSPLKTISYDARGKMLVELHGSTKLWMPAHAKGMFVGMNATRRSETDDSVRDFL